MSTEVRVPTLGESVTEATIGQWFKKVGDAVSADEPIVELETDKVTIEVPAPVSGTLEAISVNEGDTVEVGALIAAIAAGAVPAKSAEEPKQEAKTEESKAEAPKGEAAKPAEAPAAGTEMPPAPSAAKMMEERDIEPSSVAGSGKRGQVLKEDVLKALDTTGSSKAEAPAPAAPRAARAEDQGGEERVKMTRLRQTIAKRLKDAQNSAAMLTTFNEVDMKPVMDLRNSYKELFEKKHGVKLGFMGFFTRAVVHALKEIPAVNAEIDGTDIIYKNFAHIGVAVGTEKGLVVPVVRDADQMSIA
ncbi:MAG TPA: dihydrolipoamide succinyltransferase, partial [Pelagibacterium sp.]|nr:dihydrolipoamide succinyltransferase [Pelagibacterium sp.]